MLAAGTYEFWWEGLSSSGMRVAMGNAHTLTASAGGHLVVPSIDFSSGSDPRGTDASVSAHWTVGGMAPTTTTCSAGGIDRVRVAVIQPTGPLELATLTAACTAGVIDTRPMAVLAAGSVVLQLQALDAHGAVVFSGAMATTSVPRGPAHVALYGDVPVDFASSTFDPRGSDANVVFGWTLDHQMPAIDVCGAVRVDTIGLVLDDPSDTMRAGGVTVASAPCARGTFDSAGIPIVRAGSYLAWLEARDATGAVRARTPWGSAPIAFAAGAVVTSPTIDFTFPTTLVVTLDWAIPRSTGTGTCTNAGVATMTYALAEHVSGMVIAQGTTLPCAETLSLDATNSPTLGSVADYDLVVHGVSADMARAWASPAMTCSNFAVASGGITFEACVVASL